MIRREDETETKDRIEEAAKTYRERFGARVLYIDEPPLAVSSTEVRALLRSGAETAKVLTPEVADYIKERRLYRE